MPADVNLGIDITKKGEGDKEAALGLEAVAKAADNAKDELAQLDRKLLETRAAMLAAGKEFVQTGDKSPFKSLLRDEKQLDQVRKTLSRLTQDVKGDLENAGTQSSRSFVDRLNSGLRSGLNSISGGFESSLVTTLVAAAAGAAPAIGAAVSAAVLLGLGGATLAGGIVVAAHDPAVKAAFGQLGDEVKTDLAGAAAGLTEPLVRSAHTFSDVWNKDVRPGLAQDFNVLAPSIDHLSAGVAAFAHNVMPGFNHAIQESAPLLNQLGSDTLPRMGSAIGNFFSEVAYGAPGAKRFFSDLTTGADLSIEQLGAVTLALSKLYEVSRNGSATGPLLTGTFNTWAHVLEYFDGSTKNANTSLQVFNSSEAQQRTAAQAAAFAAQEQANALQKLNQITQSALGQQLSLAQANEGVSSAFLGLKDSVNQHGKSMRDDTAAGQANRESILGAVGALAQQRDAAIAAAGGTNASKAAVDAANGAYDRGVGSLMGLAHQLGLSDDQVRALIGSMNSIPNIERTVTIDYITTHINRTVSDQGGASPYQQSANVLLGRIPQAYGGITLAAARGLVAGAPSILIGERTVPEAAIPAPNSGISQQRADMLLGTVAGWWGRQVVPAGGGGHTFNINVNAGFGTDGADVAEKIRQVITADVMNNGGNVQGTFGRRGH